MAKFRARYCKYADNPGYWSIEKKGWFFWSYCTTICANTPQEALQIAKKRQEYFYAETDDFKGTSS